MSAYRTAPGGAPPLSVALLCAACGARSEERLSGASFRCATCAADQPVLRDEPLPATAAMRVVRSEPGGYSTLVPFSTSIGLDDTCLGLTVACAGAEVVLSLGINSGVVTGLFLSAPVDGLPAMTLRHETEADVRSKAGQVAREAQTGDATFDREVFIESDATDGDVLASLSSPTVRAAVLALLAVCSSVDVTNEGVRVMAPPDPKTFAPERVAQLVVALRVIAGAPRAVTAAPVAPRKARAAATVIGALGLPAFVLVIVALELYEPVSAAPILAGAAAGVAVAIAAWPLVTRALRGRSTSRADISRARLASLVTGPLAGIACLLLVNGAFDRSRPRRHELVGVEVRRDDDHEDAARVTARGAEPGVGEHTYSFEDPKHRLVLPATVTVTWRDGRLGFPWEAAPATCHTPDDPPR